VLVHLGGLRSSTTPSQIQEDIAFTDGHCPCSPDHQLDPAGRQPEFDLTRLVDCLDEREQGNVFLFHKASRTALFALPKGTEVRAYRYAGCDPELPDDTPPV